MRKKLNQWDRLQALIRCPEYLKEYKEFSKLEIFKNQDYFQKRGNLLKKWGIISPIDPNEWKGKATPSRVRCFIDEPPAKPIPFRKDRDTLKYLKDNRYLILQINLTYGLEEIIEDVKPKVKEFWESVKRDSGYDTSNTELNPWEIYDMHQNDNLNKSEIARRLSGKEGTTIDNTILKAKHSQVSRAYKKALAMIKTVCNDIELKN